MAYECGATFSIKDNVSKSLGSIKGGLFSTKKAVQEMNNTWTDANGRLHDANGRFIAVGDSAKKSGSGILGLNGKLSILKRGFSGIKSSADSSGNGIKGFNNNCLAVDGIKKLTSNLKDLIAGNVGVTAAWGTIKGSVGGAASFEGMRNTLNIVMKDSKVAAGKFREAVEFANATPFETEEIVNGFVKLESYGVKTTKEVTTAVGDMAGVMGKSFDQAVEAVADAQTGELERLKEFGITKQQIVDHGAKIMADKELINNKGQITDQEAFNSVLLNLMKERYSGGMELQSKTFKGAMSTMRGEIKNTMATLAGVDIEGNVLKGGLLDKLKDGVLGVTGIVRNFAKSDIFPTLTNGISKVANIGASVFSGVKSVGVPVLNTIKGVLNSLSPYASSFSHSLKTGVKELKGTLGVEGVLAFYKIKEHAKDAFSVIKIELGKVTAAFGKFVADGGMERIGANIGKAMNIAAKGIDFCFENMDKIIPIAKIALKGFLGFKALEKTGSVFNNVSNGISTMTGAFKKVQGTIRFIHSAFDFKGINIACKGLKTVVTGTAKASKLGAISACKGIKIAALGTAKVSKTAIIGAAKGIKTGVIGTAKGIKIGVVGAAKGIKVAVTGAFKGIKLAITGVKVAFSMLTPTKLIIMGIVLAGIVLYKNWDTIKAAAHSLHVIVSEKWEAIKNKCEPVTSAIKEGWNSVKEGWNSFKNGVSHGVDLAVKRWDEMKNKCREICDDISQKWQSLTEFLKHPIEGTIRFVKENIGGGEDKPHHKTGLNRVPYDGYNAVLHEGERVLTKQETDKLDQGRLSSGGSSSPTINLNIANMNVREEADINKIATALARIIKNDGLNYV